jgi:hypothetical protein
VIFFLSDLGAVLSNKKKYHTIRTAPKSDKKNITPSEQLLNLIKKNITPSEQLLNLIKKISHHQNSS